MKDCVSCVHEYLSSTSDTCRECGIAMLNYEEAKPKSITNADRIRSMTDEELAELMEDKGDCPPIECPHDGEGAKVTRLDCKACWLDWLKQEAT